MQKRFIIVIILVVVKFNFAYGKHKISSSKQDSIYQQHVISYVLQHQYDSVLSILNTINYNQDTLKHTHKFKWIYNAITSPSLTNADYPFFIRRLLSLKTHSNVEYHNFLTAIKPDKSELYINPIYLRIKLMHFNYLINSGFIDKAEHEYNHFKEYLKTFDPTDIHFDYGTYVDNYYNIHMAIINKNIDKGYFLIDQNNKIAENMMDTSLLVKSYNLKLYFLQIEQKLEEYLQLAQTIINLQNTTQYEGYHETLFNYILALIYQYKQQPKDYIKQEIFNLFMIIYNNPSSVMKEESFILATNILGVLSPQDKYANDILKLYQVKTIKEFIAKTIQHLEKKNTPIQLLSTYETCANTLTHHQLFKEANALLIKSISITQRNFDKELADITLKHDVEFLKRTNTYKQNLIREKDKINQIITIISISIVLFFILTYLLMRSKNKKLNQLHNEKLTLIKEIHHRIKNNFQIATGMLELQLQSIEHPMIKPLINQWTNKTNVIISIHKHLYQNDTLTINLFNHIDHIIKPILNLYNLPIDTYKIDVCKNYTLNTNTALNLGLIVNELITNACKHKSNHQILKINVSCKKVKDSQYLLHISDNGSGLDCFNLNTSKSFGFKMIKNLIGKLNGSIDYQYNNGAEFSILFKII